MKESLICFKKFIVKDQIALVFQKIKTKLTLKETGGPI